MSNHRILFNVITVVLAACTMQVALGQQTVFFPTPEACVTAPVGTYSYYAPVDISRLPVWHERVQNNAAQTIKFDHDVCFRAGTAMGLKIYRAAANTPFFSTDGSTATADGRCGNDGVVVGHVPATASASPASTPALAPAVATPSAVTATTETSQVELDPVAPWVVPSRRGAASLAPRLLRDQTEETEETEQRYCESPPGVKSLWIGGWIGRQFVCHPKRTALILAGVATSYAGAAYGMGLWPFTGRGNDNGNNGSPNMIYGYPRSDWEAGPCSLWAQGGKYFRRRPIPARCF